MFQKVFSNGFGSVEAPGLENIDQVSSSHNYYRVTVLANFAIGLGV
jgi:hypothetical protein